MKTTAKWLNEYLDRPASVDEIVEGLTQAGLGCEERVECSGGDVMLDFEVTSNRGDCVSTVGLARELAAVSGRALVMPAGAESESEQPGDGLQVRNGAADLCPYYSAQIIRGVKIGPSPEWLRQRLEAIGERSVNNVVDVTNFVLFELGQPLHAFDLAKLTGGEIIVRRARDGEKLTAIDGTALTLDSSMLAIADRDRVVALGGVMGGLDTEVSETTVDIALEAASFHAANVRATSRKLRLHSPSSYRFERGVHPATVHDAATRAAQLIVQDCGGEIVGGPHVAGEPIAQRVTVAMRPSRCRALAGMEIATEEMVRLLESIELEPALTTENSEEQIGCLIPYHRLDLAREVDLIEEVIRLHGLEKIPTRDRISIEVVGLDAGVQRRRRVDAALTACGFFEVLTYSFLSEGAARSFVPTGVEVMRLQDDRRKAEPVLQASVLPGLVACRKRNQDTGARDVSLFERAACYGIANGNKQEPTMLGLLHDAADRQDGLRVIAGAIGTIGSAVAGAGCQIEMNPVEHEWFAPGTGAVVTIESKAVGLMGILNPSIQSHLGLESPIAVAEINDDLLMAIEVRPVAVQAVSSFPSIQRDLSLIVDESVTWRSIEEGVRALSLEFVESIEFVGAFRGKPIERGCKSVTLKITFRADDRTLRHEEIDPQIDRVVERMKALVGAELRS